MSHARRFMCLSPFNIIQRGTWAGFANLRNVKNTYVLKAQKPSKNPLAKKTASLPPACHVLAKRLPAACQANCCKAQPAKGLSGLWRGSCVQGSGGGAASSDLHFRILPGPAPRSSHQLARKHHRATMKGESKGGKVAHRFLRTFWDFFGSPDVTFGVRPQSK